MDRAKLDEQLRQLNDYEKELKDLEGSDIRRLFSNDALGQEWRINSGKLMLKEEEIAIHKHDRFIEFEEHSHDYLEMMVVYDGQIKHHIGDKTITLNKGDILLMDMSISHSIEMAGEEDIAVDILMKKEFFDSFFLQQIGYNDMMAGFISNAIYKQSNKEQYLYFKSGENETIWYVFINILKEFYDKQSGQDTAIRAYMLLLFNELTRNYETYLEDHVVSTVDTSISQDLIAYIDQHYRTITLNEMAKSFNYNPDYLGKQIKKYTGYTFKDLVKRRKLKEAAKLLRNTDEPILEILEKIHYSNASYFYRQFKSEYGMTPDAYRHRE